MAIDFPSGVPDGYEYSYTDPQGTTTVYIWIESSGVWYPTISGKVGPQGPKGEKGIEGKGGTDGAKGEVGVKGDKGSLGQKGSEGTKGDRGEKGIKGLPSTQPGPEGPKGPKGARGQDGLPSMQAGPQGPKGERGVGGTPGNPSYNPGPSGPKGERGHGGNPGSPGPTIHVDGGNSSGVLKNENRSMTCMWSNGSDNAHIYGMSTTSTGQLLATSGSRIFKRNTYRGNNPFTPLEESSSTYRRLLSNTEELVGTFVAQDSGEQVLGIDPERLAAIDPDLVVMGYKADDYDWFDDEHNSKAWSPNPEAEKVPVDVNIFAINALLLKAVVSMQGKIEELEVLAQRVRDIG